MGLTNVAVRGVHTANSAANSAGSVGTREPLLILLYTYKVHSSSVSTGTKICRKLEKKRLTNIYTPLRVYHPRFEPTVIRTNIRRVFCCRPEWEYLRRRYSSSYCVCCCCRNYPAQKFMWQWCVSTNISKTWAQLVLLSKVAETYSYISSIIPVNNNVNTTSILRGAIVNTTRYY